MGQDMSDADVLQVKSFAERVVDLVNFREKLSEYLKQRMNAVAPNLTALIGEIVGSKLIAHSGGLTNLAKYPASTIQILGAEKALFRALKTRGKTPKYGLIFNSSFIGRAGQKNKGRISRYLANKCAIASRIDCFSETQTSLFGEKLKGQMEERLQFLATGTKPKKNKDAMKEVMDELKSEGLYYNGAAETNGETKKKRDKKREDKEANGHDESEDEEKPKKKDKKAKKDKKRKHKEDDSDESEEEPKKKKKTKA